MLDVENLQVTLANLGFRWNFKLPEGSFLAVTGSSGVGKSTLLKSLIGMQRRQTGTVRWKGKECNVEATGLQPFGMLFQKDNVFDHLSVERNLSFGLSANGKLKSEQYQLLESAARRFGILDQLSKRASSLSGGQQQRVALARVFLQNKPVLLLDEPFASLDPDLRQDGLKWVLELQREQGATIIMVTHHLSEVEHVAQYQLEGLSASHWAFSSL
ncbi:ATP-binding cassette domain-containing protein [Reinekea forsetii]|nr:ATP-binding cassette domain-containing protein [Reinekea forsetii]